MSETIDDKVVKIDFDNREFKIKIEETIAKLEKLNKSVTDIDHRNTIRTFNTNVQRIDPKPIQQFTNSLNGLQVSFSKLEVVSATVIASMTRGFMNFSKNVYAKTIGQIKSGGLQRALNIEQAKFQMEGLGKEWKDVADDIDYAVKGTAYGLDEAARVASQLLASQVKTGKEMKTSLRAISGIAAMTNRSYSDIGNIFTKVSGNGRLMSQELLQFSASGLNAAATLTEFLNKNKEVRDSVIQTALATGKNKNVVKQFANATKLTEGNIRQLVTAGAIDFKTFAKAMDDAFGKHATAADKTFNGALANMKAALSRIGADFAGDGLGNKGFLENMRATFIALRKAIDEVRTAVKPFIESVTALSTALTKRVVKVIDRFTKRLHKGKSDLTSFSKSASEILDSITKKLGGKVKHATDKSKKSTDKATKSAKEHSKSLDKQTKEYKKLEKVANDVINGVYGNGTERQKKLTKAGYDYVKVQELINHKLLGTKLSYKSLSKEETKHSKSLANKTKEYKKLEKVANDVINGAYGNGAERQKKLTKAGYDYAKVQNIINHKLLGTKLNTELLSKEEEKRAKKLSKSSKSIKKSNETISGNILKAFKNTKKATVNISKTVNDAFSKSFSDDKDIKSFNDTLLRLSRNILNISKSINKTIKKNSSSISDNLSKIINVFKNAFKIVKVLITAFNKSFKDSFDFGKTASTASTILIKIIDKINNVSTKLFKNLSKNIYKIVRTLNGVFAVIKIIYKFVSIPVKAIIKLVSKLTGSVKGFNVNILDTAANIGDAIVAFEKWLDEVLPTTKAVDLIANVLGKLISKLKTLTKNLYDNRDIILQAVIRSLKSIGKKIVKAASLIATYIAKGYNLGIKKSSILLLKSAKLFVTNIVGNIKKLLGIHSPSTVFMLLAAFCVSGFLLGFNNYAPKIIDECIRFGGQILGLNEDFVNTAIDAVNKLISVIYTISSEALKSVYKLVRTGLPLITSIIIESIKAVERTIKALKPIDFKKIFAIAVLASVVAVFVKLAKELTELLSGVGHSLYAFSGILQETKGIFKNLKSRIKIENIKSLAVALAILTGSILVLGNIPEEQLKQGVAAVVIMMLFIGGVVRLFSYISKSGRKSIETVKPLLTSMAVVILAMVVAIRNIFKIVSSGKMDDAALEKFETIFIIFGAIIAAIGGIFGLAAKLQKKSAVAIKSTIGIAIIILAMTNTFQKLARIASGLDKSKMENLKTLIKNMYGMIAIFAVELGLISKLIKHSTSAGSSILLMTVSLVLVMKMFKEVSKMSFDKESVIKNIVFFASATTALVLFFEILNTYNPVINGPGVFTGLLGMVVAIGLMGYIASKIGAVDAHSLLKGVSVVIILGVFVKSFTKSLTPVGKDQSFKIAGTLIGLAVCVVILAILSVMLSFVSVPDLIKGVTATGVLVGLMSGLLYASDKAKKVDYKSIGYMIGAVAILGGISYVLSRMKPSKMIQGIIGVGLITGCAILLTYITKYSKGIESATILKMAAAVGVIGLIVAMLATFNPKSVAVGAGALVAVSLTLVACIAILSAIGENANNVEIKPIIAVVGAMFVISIAIAILANMKPEGVKTGAIAIGALAVVMTVVVALFAAISNISVGPGAPIVTMIAVLVTVTAAIAILAWVNKKYGDVTPITKALTSFLSSLAKALLALSVVGLVAVAVTAALPVVGIVIGVLTGVMVALGAFADKVEPIIDKGGPILVKIGRFIGDFLGSIIAGIGKGVAATIAFIGISFVPLSVGLSSLGKALQNVPENSGKILIALAAGLAAIFAEDLMQKITNVASFGLSGDPIETFSKSINGISIALAGMMKNLKGYDTKNIGVVADSILSISKAQKNLADIDEGGSELAKKATDFCTGLNKLFKAISKLKIDDEIVKRMEMIKKVVNPLIEIARKLSELNDGESSWKVGANASAKGKGLFSSITGNANFSAEGEKKLNFKKFGEQLKDFGESFNIFKDSVKGIKKKDASKLATVSSVITPYVEIAKKLSQMNDGESSWKVGANATSLFGGLGISAEGEKKLNFKKFGEQLKDFGESLILFAQSVKGLPKDAFSKFKQVSSVMGPFVELAKKLAEMSDGEGGNLWAYFSGEKMNFAKLGEQLVALGDSLVGFSSSLSTLDEKAVTNVEKCPALISGLVDIAKELSEINDADNQSFFSKAFDGEKMSLKKLGQAMQYIGNGLKAFIGLDKLNISDDLVNRVKDSISKIIRVFIDISSGYLFNSSVVNEENLKRISLFGNAVKKLGQGIKEFRSALDNLPQIDDSVIEAIRNALKKVAELSINDYADEFDSKEQIKNVKDKSRKLINSAKLDKGEKDSFINSFKILAANIVEAFTSTISSELISNVSDSYFTAAQNVIQGFVDGILSKSHEVKDTLKTVMQAGIKITMKTLDEHSPSKIFKTIGKFTMTGFIKGVKDEGVKAIKTVKGTFESIIKTAKKELIIGTAFLEPYVKAMVPDLSKYGKSVQNKVVQKAYANIVSAAEWLYKRTDAYTENTLTMKELKADDKKRDKILNNKKNIKNLKESTKQYKAAKAARKAAEKADKTAGTKEAKLEKARTKKAGKNATKEQRKAISDFNAKEKERVAKRNEQIKKSTEEMNKADKKASKKRLNAAIKNEKKAKAKLDKITNKITKAENKKLENRKTNKQLQVKILQDMQQALAEFYNGIKENIDSYMDPLSNSLDFGVNLFESVQRAQYVSVTTLIKNSEKNNKRLSDYFNKTSKLNSLNVSDSLKEYVLSLGLEGEGILDALLRANDDELSKINSEFNKQSENDLKAWFLQQETKTKTINDYKDEVKKLKKDLDPEVYQHLMTLAPEEGLKYVRMLNKASKSDLAKFNKEFKAGLNEGANTAKELVGKFADVAAGTANALTSVLNAELGKSTKNKVFTALMPTREDTDPSMNGVVGNYTKISNTLKSTIKGIAKDGKENTGKKTSQKVIDGLVAPLKDNANKENITNNATAISNLIRGGISAINNPNAKDSPKSIGKNVLEGITKGMSGSAQTKLINKIKKLSNKTIETFKEVLDIDSPSKAFANESRWIPEGIGEGVEDNASAAINPIKRLSSSLVKVYNNAINDDNLNPVVKPIVDLSDVESGISSIGDMFNDELAINAATSFARGQNAKNNSTQIITNNYNNRFNQSITSNSPLSRADIYRDTMGLIRRNMRGGLTV